MRLKRLIVIVLERSCGYLDLAPAIWWERGRPRLVRHGQIGCYLGLSTLSACLDDRWETNVGR